MGKYRVRIKNYKKVEDFDEIFETGNFYLLRGANNIGKTSVIRGICSALNAENKNDNPIGQNGDNAVIELNFKKDDQDYNLRYVLEEKNGKIVDSIILVSDDNKKINTKSDIRKLLSFNDFSVDQFFAYGLTAEGRRKQADILKQLLPQETKFELDLIEAEINTKNGKLYKDRAVLSERKSTIETIIKRSSFNVEEQDKINKLKEIRKKKDVLIEEINSFGDIESKLKEIEEIEDRLSDCNEDIDGSYQKRDRDVLFYQDEIEALKKKIEEKETKIKETNNHYQQIILKFEEEKSSIEKELSEAKKSVSNIEVYNLKKSELENCDAALTSQDAVVLISKFKENIQYKKELENVSKEFEEKDTKLKEYRERKKTIFEEADIDIPELTIIDGECMYVEGDLTVPFTEEHVSYATGGIPIVKMLVRLNQNMPIILLGKAAEYDEKSRKSILEIAQKNDCVIFGDLVDEKASETRIKIETL